MHLKETFDTLLGLGSNLGDRQSQIQTAIEELTVRNILFDVRVATMIETPPLGYVDQPNFLNTVVRGFCSLSAVELFNAIKHIESELGRVNRPRWHEREIDIDILLFGKLVMKSEVLSIPHPRMLERSFVMAPAREIAGDMIHPESGKRLDEIDDAINIDDPNDHSSRALTKK